MSIIERSPRSTAAIALNGDHSARFHATKNSEQPDSDITPNESRYGGRLYDTTALRFIGKSSLSGYIKKHPETEGRVHRLDELLFDESIEPLGLKTEHLPVMSKRQAITRGQMVLDVVSSQERRLNESLLRRASAFGVVPPLSRIAREFGSTSRFYRAIGSAESHRPSAFNDMSREDILKYLQKFAAETGRRPTWDRLHAASLRDSQRPSPNAIFGRFGIRQLSPVLELIGYPNVRNWTDDDYYTWGVKYMEANDAEVPSSADINFLSKLDRGPSTRVIMNKFGSLSLYQRGMAERYWQQTKERNANREEQLSAIEKETASGSLPIEIFEGVDDEAEIIRRHSRYLLASKLLGPSFYESKLTISKMEGTTVLERGLIGALKKVDPLLTSAEIESTALYLGIFDDLWPMDNHLTQLRILKVAKGLKICRFAYDRATAPLEANGGDTELATTNGVEEEPEGLPLSA